VLVTVIANFSSPFLAGTVVLSIESSSILTIPREYPFETTESSIFFHVPSFSHILSSTRKQVEQKEKKKERW
jgi:hypothetical protein